MTWKEEAVLSYVFGFNSSLPDNVSLDDFDDINVKEFFKDKGTTYNLT